jgi:hypothetical protein
MCAKGGKELKCSSSLEASVLGLVDRPRAPTAEVLEDLVVGNALTDHTEFLLKHVLDKHKL